MGRFLPPLADAGDPNTVGGYQAVHGRPAAFEGSDGYSYSVECVADPFGDDYAGYLLFVRWGVGDPVAVGHVETRYLVRGASREAVRSELGKVALNAAKRLLEQAIQRKNAPASGDTRPWYEIMNDE